MALQVETPGVDLFFTAAREASRATKDSTKKQQSRKSEALASIRGIRVKRLFDAHSQRMDGILPYDPR
jgi:hypothetical protein